MNEKLFSELIYDTLLQNKQNKQFNIKLVNNQELDCKNNSIMLNYDGHIFQINIEELVGIRF
jgi:hypothetical protein